MRGARCVASNFAQHAPLSQTSIQPWSDARPQWALDMVFRVFTHQSSPCCGQIDLTSGRVLYEMHCSDRCGYALVVQQQQASTSAAVAAALALVPAVAAGMAAAARWDVRVLVRCWSWTCEERSAGRRLGQPRG